VPVLVYVWGAAGPKEHAALRRLGATLAAVAAVLALTAGSTLAVAHADQSQIVITGNSAEWNSNFTLAQTFTAGITGTLAEVDLYVGVTPQQVVNVVRPAVIGDTSITVFPTTGGIPSGSAIAAESVNLVDTLPGWVVFNIPSGPAVTAGTQYAIAITENNPSTATINWYGDCATDNYSGGQALTNDFTNNGWHTVTAWSAGQGSSFAAYCQQDFAFRTFVTVPVPPDPTPTAVQSFQGATSAPTVAATPPPTSTSQNHDGGNGSLAIAVLVASFAAGAAFVAHRRYGLARR
jgi:hypothetical protein